MDTYWAPGVNHRKTYGRWAFAEFTEVYRIEAGFKAKVANEFNKMVASVTVSRWAVRPTRQRAMMATVHCRIRNCTLHSVNCRTNHVHAVVAADRAIHEVREQFQAWCTRKLKEHQRTRPGIDQTGGREKWWTQRGWDEYVDDEGPLAAVIAYVR